MEVIVLIIILERLEMEVLPVIRAFLSGKTLKKKKVDYIVTLTAFEMDAYLDEIGYELVDVSGTRSVYTRKK